MYTEALNTLLSLLKKEGISNAEFASHLGIDKTYLSRLKNGKISVRWNDIVKGASLLGLLIIVKPTGEIEFSNEQIL